MRDNDAKASRGQDREHSVTIFAQFVLFVGQHGTQCTLFRTIMYSTLRTKVPYECVTVDSRGVAARVSPRM
jgi:hypothetical protein